jgi:hypothetical protein
MIGRFDVLTVSSLVLLVFIGGCSAASSNVPTAPGVIAGADKSGSCGNLQQKYGGGSNPMLYTAQLYGHDLKVYGVGGSGLQYECSFTQGVKDPNGSMTTPNGWWYVANGSGENVLVYRRTDRLRHLATTTHIQLT